MGAEAEESRILHVNVDPELGSGIDAHSTWYGMIVDEVDGAPGQMDLRVGDCITRVGDVSLQELEDAEDPFIENLKEGAEIEVEPHCVASGAVPAGASVDWDTLQMDLDCFAEDYQVEIKVTDVKCASVARGQLWQQLAERH